MSDIKKMDIAEFRRLGYLQELNRRFLHPLGLALEVVVADDGTERLGGVWDYRDDPEGILYGDEPALVGERVSKARTITALIVARRPARVERTGCWIQPLLPRGGA